ncbi:GNAT family N-acetyltransferase [uncultured Sphingomonas sp.]|uniref:GNAT family N-acetyltransferase n=1 Tax=uncultured Sphingomonas sp. TaxID=158754 RepID=UPI0025F2F6B0|nr:GNAT family N-acetyltransferase [uncultured Sphingomonas sp.]
MKLPDLPAGYAWRQAPPGVADYLRLRQIAGLTPRSAKAAEAGLPNTIYGVTIEKDGLAVGMGRIIGDGALCLHIADIAVDPDHQGRGLGKAVMAALMAHIAAHVPAEVYVNLIADGDAARLYAQFGFEPVAPASQGMAVWINPA